jgi:ditrans,polycis-polyprenyl diphosphate synthase
MSLTDVNIATTIPGLSFIQHYGKNLIANILRVGPVPQHVAFIMDGNRRFAKQNHQETREGHNAGFQSLSHILELCYNTGIKVVTVYAFSIENFNRTPYEVDSLMEITKTRLLQIIERGYVWITSLYDFNY